jgi:hypothetical protein
VRYQAFAYAKVLGLPQATLVYPEDGEVVPSTHTIRRDGVVVRVVTLPVGAGTSGYRFLDDRTLAAATALLAEVSTVPAAA